MCVESEVIDMRESKSRSNADVVTFVHKAYNQRNELVGHCKRSGLQRQSPGVTEEVA